VNCWVIWHNVTLDVHAELLENLNGNEVTCTFSGPYVVYKVTDVMTYQMLSRTIKFALSHFTVLLLQ